MSSWLSLVISLVALTVSITTAWVTLFHAGKLQMTQPTVVFFGLDGKAGRGDRRRLKVFLRTLLFSTGRRGQTIESLYVNLQRGESRQNFSIWVYGDQQLARGSGLFVPFEGIACNHHFLLPDDGSHFQLLSGEYTLRVFAKRAGSGRTVQLAKVPLFISQHHSEQLFSDNAGIYFDWGPDSASYHAHIEDRPAKTPAMLLAAFENDGEVGG
jgi:hypothetical protein